MTVTIAIRTATSRDHDHIASLLAAAFAASPVACWLVSDPDRRQHLARLLLDRVVQAAIEEPYATVQLTDDGNAAAIWYDHTGDYDTTRVIGSGLDAGFLSIAELLGSSIGAQVRQIQDALAAVVPVEPHYRLAYLGVDEHHREHRLARSLLDHHHQRLPDTAVHTIAQNPTDLGLLGTAGYLPSRPIVLPGPLKLWPARRPPLARLAG